MPLHWSEVTKNLQMNDFTIFNAVKRLQLHGDIFKGVFGKGINLKETLNKTKTVFGGQELHPSLKI